MKNIIAILFLLQSVYSFAQIEREQILKEISIKIQQNYIDEKTYKKVDSLFKSDIQSGNFKSLNDKEFGETLTQKLRAVTNDKHFFVKYLENYIPEKVTDEKQKNEQNNFHNSLENFGFENVQRLGGNIGYINYKGFAEPKSSEKTLASAMNFVANTNSLIIDLRENGGGDNGTLLLFCSYFFNDKIELYSTFFRNKDKTVKNKTSNKLLGQKYLDKNIYILTSEKTFSAGEAVAYFLQERKLAKVIGEKTGGAANPVEHFFIQNKFLLLVPSGKITSSFTGKNWEHIGVIPDKSVKSEEAFKVAYVMALKEILGRKIETELTETDIKNLIIKLEK